MRQLKITNTITDRRESATLEKYFTEISRIEMLTVDEEVDLARRIKQGDKTALDKLTKANLRFVVSVAKQYQNGHMPLNDLINEGNLGLIKAAQKFDETRGFKFISYAVWWIRQSIMQAIAENGRIVRLPANKTNALNKLKTATGEWEQQYEREPTPEELAEILEMDLKEIKGIMTTSVRQVSVDAPFDNEDGGTLLDVMSDDATESTDKNVEYNESLSIETERALSILSERERKILKLFFGIGIESPMTLDQIGEIMGTTRERVRQIKEKALKKMRASSKAGQLAEYLG